MQQAELSASSQDALEAHYRVAETVEYIVGRGYKVVTLQFPDELLAHAGRVAVAVQAGCRARGHEPQTYILADTTYNSLSVDEVAAAHVGADCVVHYGRASLTKLSRLPAFFVFPQQQLDVPAAAAALAGASIAAAADRPVVVFLDQPHLAARRELAAVLAAQESSVQWVLADVPTQQLEPQQLRAQQQGAGGCCGDAAQACHAEQQPAACCGSGTCAPSPPKAPEAAAELDADSASVGSSFGRADSIAGYRWALPEGTASLRDCALAWVGSQEAPALTQLQLTFNGQPWAVYDADAGHLTEGLPMDISRTLRRRYYLVQKARDARIVGILVGTLGVAGYQDAIDRLRAAARAAGKKTYTLLVGKPSPAKLANFPEVEVFVMVADPQGQLLDCKEYFAPVITPHEAMLAFKSSEGAWEEGAYRLDFDGLLQGEPAGAKPLHSKPRFSLLDGSYHADEGQLQEESDGEAPEDSAAAAAGSSEDGDPSTALALQAQAALQLTPAPDGRSDLVQAKSAADYLVHKRTWQGVEAPLVGAEPKAVEKAVPGLSGRAAGFAGEGQAAAASTSCGGGGSGRDNAN